MEHKSAGARMHSHVRLDFERGKSNWRTTSCIALRALVRFLGVPIEGTVSSPARFNSPTGDDLCEFIDPSLTLFCIVGTDGYFNHVNPAW
jgi:hypothetical protein